MPAMPRLSLFRHPAVILAICVLSLLFDAPGYVLAVVGLFLLWKYRILKLPARLGLTAAVLLPKALFFWLNRRLVDGVFQLQMWTYATSSTLWTWSLLVFGIGVGCFFMADAFRRRVSAPEPWPRIVTVALVSLMGIAFVGMSIFGFVGWNDDFQVIAAGEGGRWRLTHLVRGTVASFSTADVEAITVDDVRLPESVEPLWGVRVRLRDGRSFSLQTASMGTEAKLKSLAEAMDLPAGVMHLRMPPGPEWVNQGRKERSK